MKKRINVCGFFILCLVVLLGLSGCGVSLSDIRDREEESSDRKKGSKSDADKAGTWQITYQTVEQNPSSQAMKDTVYKLQSRLEFYTAEGSVRQKNDHTIVVELPEAEDIDEMAQMLGASGSLEFVAPKKDGGGETVLTGEDIKTAKAKTQTSETGQKEYCVQLILTEEGAEKFGEATKDNIGNQIAIMFDERQISNPTVNAPIYDGKPVITGVESKEEAEELAVFFRIGTLSLELEEVDRKLKD